MESDLENIAARIQFFQRIGEAPKTIFNFNNMRAHNCPTKKNRIPIFLPFALHDGFWPHTCSIYSRHEKGTDEGIQLSIFKKIPSGEQNRRLHHSMKQTCISLDKRLRSTLIQSIIGSVTPYPAHQESGIWVRNFSHTSRVVPTETVYPPGFESILPAIWSHSTDISPEFTFIV